jgi:PTH1 family peptidyl-tRNA hydrolase
VGVFTRGQPDVDDARWIVVGLGNPGPQYESTRHNAGAMVIDELLRRSGGKLKSHKSGCLTSEANWNGTSVVLARPVSFMNESGGPIGKLVRWYKTPLDHLLVIHDELDIPFAEVRVKQGGGTAGHNGLRSIASHLGNQFARIRVGVGRPPGRQDAVDYVLQGFSAAQRKDLNDVISRAADAAERATEVGVERAMNEVNTRSED